MYSITKFTRGLCGYLLQTTDTKLQSKLFKSVDAAKSHIKGIKIKGFIYYINESSNIVETVNMD